MTQFEKRKSGIISPKPKKVPCGYCNRTINQRKQPNEKIATRNGLPICQICLIKKTSRYGDQIERDRQRYEKDVKKAAEKGARENREKEKKRISRISSQSTKNLRNK